MVNLWTVYLHISHPSPPHCPACDTLSKKNGCYILIVIIVILHSKRAAYVCFQKMLISRVEVGIRVRFNMSWDGEMRRANIKHARYLCIMRWVRWKAPISCLHLRATSSLLRTLGTSTNMMRWGLNNKKDVFCTYFSSCQHLPWKGQLHSAAPSPWWSQHLGKGCQGNNALAYRRGI